MPATTAYCALADVQRVLSVAGVNLRLDDDPSIYLDVIDEASREVDLYLLHRYQESDLAVNRWVKHCAATIAAWMFSTRRGNPAPVGVQSRFDHYLERLERIAANRMSLSGIAPRRVEAPTLSAPRIRLDPYPRTVIERSRSSTRNLPEDYAQQTDSLDWFNFGAGI